MKIGFVGLGHMGQPMARNLVRAHHDVTVHNRSRAAANVLAQEGATIAETPADAARGKETVITMLADDKAVDSVVFGPHGLLEGMQPGSVHVSMSTISPNLSKRLAAAHAQRGQRYVAAPVFGRPEAAAAAKLFIVAAGAKDALATARPVLEILGQRAFEVGEQTEHANYIKLFGNFLITCVLEGLGEVFAVARKAEINPTVVFEVLSESLFNAPVYKNYGPKIIAEEFSPAGFKMPLGLKDVSLMLGAAEQLSAPMPFADIIRDRFLSAIANGYGNFDWSAMTLVIAQEAGLNPKTRAPRSEAAD